DRLIGDTAASSPPFDADETGEDQRCGAEPGGNRKGMREKLSDRKVAPSETRAEIAAREAGEIIEILPPERLIEPVEPAQILHDARIERPFEVERAARRNADQKESDRDDRKERRHGIKQALSDVALQWRAFRPAIRLPTKEGERV